MTSIEEAIFFLGLRKIRQMAMATRVLEEMEAFTSDGIEGSSADFWRHSIGMAIMSCEVLTMTNGVKDDDQYYISGLFGDAGKLVMLVCLPDEFKASRAFDEPTPRKHLERERKEFGFTHADLGAIYLEMNNLSPDVVEAVLFHHEPEKAGEARLYAAGGELADVMTRRAGFKAGFNPLLRLRTGIGSRWTAGRCCSLRNVVKEYGKASILRSIDSLPSLLHGLLD